MCVIFGIKIYCVKVTQAVYTFSILNTYIHLILFSFLFGISYLLSRLNLELHFYVNYIFKFYFSIFTISFSILLEIAITFEFEVQCMIYGCHTLYLVFESKNVLTLMHQDKHMKDTLHLYYVHEFLIFYYFYPLYD